MADFFQSSGNEETGAEKQNSEFPFSLSDSYCWIQMFLMDGWEVAALVVSYWNMEASWKWGASCREKCEKAVVETLQQETHWSTTTSLSWENINAENINELWNSAEQSVSSEVAPRELKY